jgi:hypothetical protein
MYSGGKHKFHFHLWLFVSAGKCRAAGNYDGVCLGNTGRGSGFFSREIACWKNEALSRMAIFPV